MTATRTTSTFQWDTVFAIPVDHVNTAIVQQKATPSTFDYTGPKKQNSIKGDFKDWQIVANGDGKNINMSIPISDVSGSISGLDFGLDSATLTVQVNLEYIPADTRSNDANITPLHLKVKTKSDDPTIPVVSLYSTDFSSDPTGDAVKYLKQKVVEDIIPSLVIAWLNENLVDFAHVFCTVELNKYIDHSAGWKWSKPTDVGYAYVDGTDDQDSVLGILAMTGGRKRTVKQSDIIDPNAIPKGSIAGFLVAEKLFLEELILPTITLHWPSASLEQFEIVPNGNTSTGRYEWVLQLKKGQSFSIKPVKYKDGDGNDVQKNPEMKTLTIATDGLTITMAAYTETAIGSSVIAWNKSTHHYTLELGKNGKGEQTIKYKQYSTPTSTHGSRVTGIGKILQWMEIAIGVIATIVLGLMTGGAAFVAGALIIGVLTGLAAASPTIVQAVNTDASPSADLLTFNTTTPIKWANSKVFKLTQVQLNGPFQLGGDPHFDTPA
ncbi:MAG TPA: hypothetical protein DCE41_25915 [Cytophagales bacterium]|nr:hypothetical protein [Cytophagales bacterium]HAA20268.1 hypothetical protein [Cytophagales bacterium]HAP58003.1 hypothetical protein [Cytophagales bacterium]